MERTCLAGRRLVAAVEVCPCEVVVGIGRVLLCVDREDVGRDGGVDDNRGMRVFNESGDTCLGAVEEHLVRACAEDEKCRQIVREVRTGSQGQSWQ